MVELDGRYRIERLLGAGGMGRVFACRRISDERAFALKVLTGRRSPEALARFAGEARIAAALDHPNLVAVHDVNLTAEGHIYLVMDLAHGASLKEHRARFGEPAWALPILRQVARGLEALAARGVVHRDLKPSNVLCRDADDQAPVVQIADFGIAALVTAEAPAEPSGDVTRPVVGSPLYMAPELMRGGRAQPACDVFSFAVMACELLTGSLPGSGATPAERSLPRALVDERGVPAKIVRVLEACLAPDPEARPSAKQLLVELAPS
jgi:serine/threonine protein kinase